MSEVYRELMSPVDELRVTPKWPEFVVLRSWVLGEPGVQAFYAVTNAGRPKLPYFWKRIGPYTDDVDDQTLIDVGREALDEAYASAHPNGCPEIGH